MKYVLYSILLIYILAVIVLYIFQRKLLYFPSPVPLQDHNFPQGVALWPNVVHPKAIEFNTKNAKGIVILFHGNAGGAVDRSYYGEVLGSLGYKVYLVEYPGYSGRPGSPNEFDIVKEGTEIVLNISSVNQAPIFLMGESLGAGVAAAVAHKVARVIHGVFLITPWDNLPATAQQAYPIFPVKYLVKDKYNSVKNLSNKKFPVGLLIAGQDQVIPLQRARVLQQALGSGVRVWELQDAGHNDWESYIESNFWVEVLQFLNQGS